LALTLYPASLIWYGWTSEKGIQWAVPAIASIFFGLGMMLVMGTVQTALTEFTPKRSSSGVAMANFVRNVLACTGAVVTQPMIDGIGNGWMCTLIGLLAFVTGISAIASLRIWGPQWRVLMDRKLNATKS
jgi:predicted MFS family arabinose efflux permease